MTSSPRPPGSTDDTARWTRSAHALHRYVPDGVVVLLLPDGEPELLTGPGGALWDLLDSPSTLPELAGGLAARYDHDPDAVERDLRRTIELLQARGLVVAAP